MLREEACAGDSARIRAEFGGLAGRVSKNHAKRPENGCQNRRIFRKIQQIASHVKTIHYGDVFSSAFG
jgi:hypothetical protein